MRELEGEDVYQTEIGECVRESDKERVKECERARERDERVREKESETRACARETESTGARDRMAAGDMLNLSGFPRASYFPWSLPFQEVQQSRRFLPFLEA